MINLLKYLSNKQLRHSQLSLNNRGFTFIELLVTLVISSIVLGALLTFMNNMLTSERQEQAKATTEQEIQAALDYIASDLQEAVYIYNAEGIDGVGTKPGIKSQLPNSPDRVPILVFWKRTFFPGIDSTGNATAQGCLVRLPAPNTDCDKRDYFVYSLVAYYLIKDNSSTWSSTARIGRWEIRDGIKDPFNPNNYLTNPDPGFKQFDLNLPGTLTEKMNAWTKSNSTYTANTTVLVDYVDHSSAGAPALVGCANTSSAAQQVPANGTANNSLGIYSFYACVDTSRTLARVYLRGNALARIQPGASYTNNRDTYFPTANVQVQGRGLLGSE